MEAPLPDEVREQLGSFEAVLLRLETSLKPFLGAGTKDLDSQLESPIDRAQLQLALAQAAAGLFSLYLKASGLDPADHPLQKEQERLRAVGKRVKKAAAERDLAASRRMLAMDVAGVNRFINAAMGSDLSAEQRAALRSSKGAGSGGEGKEASGKRKQRGGGEGEAAAAEAFLAEVAAELPAAGGASGPAAAMAADPGSSDKKKRKKGKKQRT